MSKSKKNEPKEQVKVSKYPIKIKFTVPSINHRVGPGYGFPTVGTINNMDKEFTIIDEKNGWLELEDCTWVDKQYTTEV